jgi:hypothetical protein
MHYILRIHTNFVHEEHVITYFATQPRFLLSFASFYVPHNRKENGSTAEQIDQNKDLLPDCVLGLAFLTLLNDNVGNVVQNLYQRYNNVNSIRQNIEVFTLLNDNVGNVVQNLYQRHNNVNSIRQNIEVFTLLNDNVGNVV